MDYCRIGLKNLIKCMKLRQLSLNTASEHEVSDAQLFLFLNQESRNDRASTKLLGKITPFPNSDPGSSCLGQPGSSTSFKIQNFWKSTCIRPNSNDHTQCKQKISCISNPLPADPWNDKALAVKHIPVRMRISCIPISLPTKPRVQFLQISNILPNHVSEKQKVNRQKIDKTKYSSTLKAPHG